jgi:hypothetical protein
VDKTAAGASGSGKIWDGTGSRIPSKQDQKK